MELIRISDRKLKIMLTPTDMCHFELDAAHFGEDSAEMHRAFRLLLDEVRKLTDFDADDHRISVQYFPSREGGCEMFISNLQSDDREYSTCAKSMTALQKVPLQLQPAKRNGSFRRECAYRFEELQSLLLACQRLLQIGYLCESSAYRDEQTYFLILTVTSSSPFSLPDELDFLVEYGTIQNPATLLLYIREHATLIRAGDAITVLGDLA